MIERGSIVVTALPGDFGKPRPALVVQSEDAHVLNSCIVCPLTTYEEGSPIVRVPVSPNSENGLERQSYVMVDKIIAMPSSKLHRQIGKADDAVMSNVSRVLSVILGLV